MLALDHTAYPHIFDLVLDSCSYATLLRIRLASQFTFAHVNARLFQHIKLEMTQTYGNDDYSSNKVLFKTSFGAQLMPSFAFDDTRQRKVQWNRYAPAFRHTRTVDLIQDIYPPFMAAILDLIAVDSEGDPNSHAAASDAYDQSAESVRPKPKHLRIRQFGPEITTLPPDDHLNNRNLVISHSFTSLDKTTELLRYWRVDPSTIRMSQDLHHLTLVPLADCENVLYFRSNCADQRLMDSLRRSLVNSIKQPRFSLTIVVIPFTGQSHEDNITSERYREMNALPVPLPLLPSLDEFLQAVCNVHFDPEAIEQVELFKARNTIQLVPLEKYLVNNLQTVVFETSQDRNGTGKVQVEYTRAYERNRSRRHPSDKEYVQETAQDMLRYLSRSPGFYNELMSGAYRNRKKKAPRHRI